MQQHILQQKLDLPASRNAAASGLKLVLMSATHDVYRAEGVAAPQARERWGKAVRLEHVADPAASAHHSLQRIITCTGHGL